MSPLFGNIVKLLFNTIKAIALYIDDTPAKVLTYSMWVKRTMQQNYKHVEVKNLKPTTLKEADDYIEELKSKPGEFDHILVFVDHDAPGLIAYGNGEHLKKHIVAQLDTLLARVTFIGMSDVSEAQESYVDFFLPQGLVVGKPENFTEQFVAILDTIPAFNIENTECTAELDEFNKPQ